MLLGQKCLWLSFTLLSEFYSFEERGWLWEIAMGFFSIVLSKILHKEMKWIQLVFLSMLRRCEVKTDSGVKP